jgi:aerobic carbon-monoxide dehydrogenase medium subunit
VKPAPFAYRRPATLEEATAILAQHGDGAKVIAGGQSLVPMLNMRLTRFEVLVDLDGIAELKSLSLRSGQVTVGTMVRQVELEEKAEVADAAPLLAKATPLIGHFQIRNRGTVGGSIAHADPAAEYPAVALALDAEMELTGGSGARRVLASSFFTGTWETAIQPDEILTTVTFPAWGDAGFAIEEVARRHGDFAMAGACTGIRLDGNGRVERAAISLFGVASTPVRASEAESLLVGMATDDIDPAEVGHAVAVKLEPPEDLHASSSLRRRIAVTVVKRSLVDALKEAGRG